MKKLLSIMVAVCAVLLPAFASAKTVSGTVVDATTGEAVIGASVVPIGTKQGAATDVDGKFHLNVPDNVKQIKITMIPHGFDVPDGYPCLKNLREWLQYWRTEAGESVPDPQIYEG